MSAGDFGAAVAAAVKPTVDAVETGRLSEATLTTTYQRRRDGALKSWLAAVTAGTSYVRITGHSIIAGSGATDSAHQFAQYLGASIRAVDHAATVTINGYSGYTSTQILAQVEGFGTETSPVDLVVFMGIVNDQSNTIPPATTAANLDAILAAYSANQPTGSADPTFALILEWEREGIYTYGWDEYRAVALAFAAANDNVLIIDAGTAFGGSVADNPLDLFYDGVHPNDAGHRLLAQIVSDVLVAPAKPVAGAPQYPAHIALLAPMQPLSSTNWNSANVASGSSMYGNAFADSNGTQGASITFEWWGDAGTYNIRFATRRSTNRGRYDVYIDGALQGTGATWDGYAASVTDSILGSDGFSVATSGRHTITLTMATKNTSSTGYVGSLSGLFLTRTA